MKGRTAARVTGQILLYIKGGELQARPGQNIRWRSTLRQPSRFGNPGEFNYPLYLAARGIYVTSFLNRAEDLTVLFIPQQRTLIWRTGVTALQCISKRSCRTTLQGTCNRSCLAGGEESASNSANSSPVAVSRICSQSPDSTSVFWLCSYNNFANGFTHVVNVWCSGAHPSGFFRFC